MNDRSPFALMESAWATRRASFQRPDVERRAAIDSVRTDLDRAADLLRNTNQEVPYAHALHLRAHVELDVGEEERAVGWLRLPSVGMWVASAALWISLGVGFVLTAAARARDH